MKKATTTTKKTNMNTHRCTVVISLDSDRRLGHFLSLFFFIYFLKSGEGGACCRFLFDQITLPECLFA